MYFIGSSKGKRLLLSLGECLFIPPFSFFSYLYVIIQCLHSLLISYSLIGLILSSRNQSLYFLWCGFWPLRHGILKWPFSSSHFNVSWQLLAFLIFTLSLTRSLRVSAFFSLSLRLLRGVSQKWNTGMGWVKVSAMHIMCQEAKL